PAEPTIELPLPVSMQPTVQVESLEPVEREPEPVEQQAKVIQLRVPKPEPAPEQAILDEKTPLAKNALRPPDNPGSASAASQAKRLNQLPAGFIDHLPKMNIDIHSYDKQRARSYVLINMEKYREGDYLAEGPLLSEILADGVVLEHMGERFILPIGNY
ncbi:MAG: general secretion pathway protein GspB, partial [Gammaproteobacteria bacterium]|nr:general secretion pathway protein GspB [Gammaproteobacteria bacterium]